MAQVKKKVAQLHPREALKNIQDVVPEAEFHALARVVSKDVVGLATDEAFALRDNKGEIRAFKQRLTLTAQEGTLIQPVQGGPYVVSAQGYEVWAEAAGAAVILPRQVLVDGKWNDNPHVLRNPSNGRILAVYARACAFRFSSKGLPQVSDWTTIFDTPSYRMIDLLAKAKKFPQAFRLLPEEMKPEDEGTWSRYPFDEASNLWINTSHDEALQWFSQIINREKKSLDFAQTFARRNALKHLSGIQKAPGPVWDLQVFCWRPTSGNIIKWDSTVYTKLQERVDGLVQGPADEFASTQPAQITHGAEDVDHTAAEPVDPEDVIDIGEPPPEQAETTATPWSQPQGPEEKKPAAKGKAPQPKTDEERKLVSNYISAQEMFDAEYETACKEFGLDPDAHHDIDTMAKVMKRINELLDS